MTLQSPLQYLRFWEDPTSLRGSFSQLGVLLCGMPGCQRHWCQGLAEMSRCRGWDFDAPSSPIAAQRNERIARNQVSKVLLARWLVFDLFIKVPKSLGAGILDTSIRQQSLLFQTLPLVLIKGMDPFSALQCLFSLDLRIVGFERSFGPYIPKLVLGDAFDPAVDTFYVLDEAHTAGRQHTVGFADTTIWQPVLQLIIQHLVEIPMHVLLYLVLDFLLACANHLWPRRM